MYRSNLRHFCLPLISACLLAAPIAHAEDPGPSIVQRLQARYDDTAKQCDDGLAAFYCNGVIVRGIRDHSRPDFWNPTPEGIARDGISASYIRKDVGNIYTAGRAGFIMRELKSPDTYPVKLRCAFPTDSATAFREKSCASKTFPLPCHLSGVTDIATWREHYLAYPAQYCYFEPTAEWFQLSIDVREHFPIPEERDIWNEIIFGAWAQDIPDQLPIEAIFFSGEGPGLEEARVMQDRFIQASGKFVPVVRIALDHPGTVFFYAPKNQSQRYLAAVKAPGSDKAALQQP